MMDPLYIFCDNTCPSGKRDDTIASIVGKSYTLLKHILQESFFSALITELFHKDFW